MESKIAEWLTLVIPTGLFSALATQGLAGLLDRRKERRTQRSFAVYGASRIAIILEEYAFFCANAAQDIRNGLSSCGAIGKLQMHLPELRGYPDEILWESLDPDLMNSVLSLPLNIKLSNQYISCFSDVLYQSIAYENSYLTCVTECILIGHKAKEIAYSLRRHYNLSCSQLCNTWVEAYLDDELRLIETSSPKKGQDTSPSSFLDVATPPTT